MNGKLFIVMLVVMSVSMTCVAKKDTNIVPDTEFQSWYKTPKNLEKSADTEFNKFMATLTSLHTRYFSQDDLTKKLPNKEDLKSWIVFLEEAKTFVSAQHKKLEPTMKKLIDLWDEFSKIINLIKLNSADDHSKMCQEILNDLPALYKEINTIGYSTFNTTRRARHIVGYVALQLETTLNHVIKRLQEKNK